MAISILVTITFAVIIYLFYAVTHPDKF
ncbi:potassium-transporting ATPase subunit F [Rouxiella badensis]|nr:potassium-transporting ATPase subunit F [Rouxiella badensis]QOI57917.1 potassium-transporting ATPase subunit F [Rouxiella badensis subsp. acadiensis]MCC3720964.1 potassium-transporting ATPase subunit F [Rouxiella badensis]MCC3729587.1 potassium-transporting ATPase subunit F [Rouxiella badensis]MCC3735386.1 potassium-transporting ATPase subunit F [Rouxiella badensis]